MVVNPLIWKLLVITSLSSGCMTTVGAVVGAEKAEASLQDQSRSNRKTKIVIGCAAAGFFLDLAFVYATSSTFGRGREDQS